MTVDKVGVVATQELGREAYVGYRAPHHEYDAHATSPAPIPITGMRTSRLTIIHL